MKNSILLLVIAVLATACASKPAKMERPSQSTGCSCSDYLPMSPRPRWADTEGLDNGVYKSQGIAECSGIKSMDFEDADNRARENLSRMLSVEVESEVTLIRKDFGGGVGGSAGSKIESKHASKAILENSSVYGRWVDPTSCSIYSGIRISKNDIARVMREMREKEARRLYNKAFVVAAEQGEHQSTISQVLEQSLGEKNVKRILSARSDETFTLQAEIQRIDVLNDGKLIKVNLKLSIFDPAQALIWTQQIKGKAVAFSAQPKNVMVEKALKDALQQVSAQLDEIMSKEISG